MWLINTSTLHLHDFTDHRSAPPYAILSHCWGPEETSFGDYVSRQNRDRAGYRKIIEACEHVRNISWPEGKHGGLRKGFEWLWVDTCCIDKRSSSELSEAINSMYTWYEAAQICIAYLVDVDVDTAPGNDTTPRSLEQFRRSRWFTRGWTLQELIAPSRVTFVDKKWRCVGTKHDKGHGDDPPAAVLATTVEEITGIPELLLRKKTRLSRYSVAQRMSWASGRQTTRTEDTAYCLLGLFALNMPLLYGEGPRAFLRMQHEILRHELGDSLFAWRPTMEAPCKAFQLFASSPAHFAGSAGVIDIARRSGPIFTSRGHWIKLKIPLPPQKVVYERKEDGSSSQAGQVVIRLSCGQWTKEGEVRTFTPCVLQLTSVPSTPYLLRNRGLKFGTYFFEDDIQSIEDWEPATEMRTRYILVHRGETEPWRGTLSAIDLEGKTPAQEKVVLNFPLDRASTRRDDGGEERCDESPDWSSSSSVRRSQLYAGIS